MGSGLVASIWLKKRRCPGHESNSQRSLQHCSCSLKILRCDSVPTFLPQARIACFRDNNRVRPLTVFALSFRRQLTEVNVLRQKLAPAGKVQLGTRGVIVAGGGVFCTLFFVLAFASWHFCSGVPPDICRGGRVCVLQVVQGTSGKTKVAVSGFPALYPLLVCLSGLPALEPSTELEGYRAAHSVRFTCRVPPPRAPPPRLWRWGCCGCGCGGAAASCGDPHLVGHCCLRGAA